MVIALFAALFSLFPLTDTDIWWHLACGREWVTTWTPVRGPVVNVHEYFQQVVGLVYGIGGAPLLVTFKALLWGAVFALFRPQRGRGWLSLLSVVLLFVFRYQLEMRPVVFSLLFLGIFWNVLPKIFGQGKCIGSRCEDREHFSSRLRQMALVALVFVIQFVWCKCQGLYILGPLFAALVMLASWLERCRFQVKMPLKTRLMQLGFVLLLFAEPFLHREGLRLFLYPFGLLDRLLGMSQSAAVFATEIAENRSPLTLLAAGENVLASTLMVLLCVAGIVFAVVVAWRALIKKTSSDSFFRETVLSVSLAVTAILALVAERNFVLFLPLLLSCTGSVFSPRRAWVAALPAVLMAFVLGLWVKSLAAYDMSMVAYQRVPVDAAHWMAEHPHEGKLFNDDRAGGYLEFVNPGDSVFMDGRFILKTAEFFERYLEYAERPEAFLQDTDSMNVDRAIFPLRYYARWDKVLQALDAHSRWQPVYHDNYFVVYDKK